MAAPMGCGASASISSVAAPAFAELLLVRHVETTWNSLKIIQGHMESDLNENGRQQAIAVANRLSKEAKSTAIYSSDLSRAAETAQTIANYCNLPKVIMDPMLWERHLGDIQGLTLHDASEKKPMAYNQFLSSSRDQDIMGGGESLNQLHKRCVSALEKIARKHKRERVIVVSHGGVLREIGRRPRTRRCPAAWFPIPRSTLYGSRRAGHQPSSRHRC